MNPLPDASVPPEMVRGIDTVVVGLGGAGGRIVSGLVELAPGTARFRVDTEVLAPADGGEEDRVILGRRQTRGLGCGADLQLAQKIAESEVALLKERIQARLVILVAGIGGGVGGGMSPVLARCAREAGSLVVGVLIEPFDFEGGLRRHNAEQCRIALQAGCDVVVRLSNQAVVGLAPETSEIRDLTSLADRLAVRVIDGLLRLLRGPALIPIGLAELERWARGRQSEGVVAFASARGEDRVRRLWADLEGHPYLAHAGRLAEAGGVLLHVTGGAGLTLTELNHLEAETRRVSPRAQVLVGATVDETLGDEISALVLAVRDGVGLPPVSTERSTEPAGQRVVVPRTLVFEDAPRSGLSGGTLPEPGSLPRESSRGRPAAAAKRKAQQQQFEFVPAWTGRFDRAEGTLHEGENLDEPTFVRRGVKLN